MFLRHAKSLFLFPVDFQLSLRYASAHGDGHPAAHAASVRSARAVPHLSVDRVFRGAALPHNQTVGYTASIHPADTEPTFSNVLTSCYSLPHISLVTDQVVGRLERVVENRSEQSELDRLDRLGYAAGVPSRTMVNWTRSLKHDVIHR